VPAKAWHSISAILAISPTGLGVDTLFTISALIERSRYGLARDHGWAIA
jgi:hypothetical protein